MNSSESLFKYTEYMQGRVSPSTLQIYVHSLKQFFASANSNALTPEFAQEYIDSLTKAGKSPSTVGLKAHAIMSFFRWKKMNIHLDCPSIPPPKIEYLSMVEVKKLMVEARPPLEKALVVVLFDTAVRVSELLNLSTENIDWGGFIKIVRKGGREEQVNISQRALSTLKDWLDKRQFSSKRVFGDLSYYETWLIIKRIGIRAGIAVHPHMLRHSRAVQLRLAGASLEDIKDHLGHRSINTTSSIYSSLKAVDLKGRLPSW